MLAPLWDPDGIYVNTASCGLPPQPAWGALQCALEDWRRGRAGWDRQVDAVDEARAAFARLVHVRAEDVAIGATVSGLLGLVAASLPRTSRIVVPEGDFTSLLWPLGLHKDVRAVPLADLANAASCADVVAFSAVQSSDGTIADLDALARCGAMTIVDATQGVGWLSFDASRFDVVLVHAYKWLMAPRGTAFMTVRRDRLADVVPWAANWYAGNNRRASYYGFPLRLAAGARRLDTSPSWHNWIATAASLATVEDLGVERIHGHDVGLANRFRLGLGLETSDSAIVTTRTARDERLERAGVVATVRAGRLRTSWHAYNSESDVDRLLDVLSA